MTPEQIQEALRCAEAIEDSVFRHWMQDELSIAANQGYQHIKLLVGRVQELEAKLEAIGAGGVGSNKITQKG